MMLNPKTETEILAHLVRWGEEQHLVRAMILTSSRAIPHRRKDAFSDYDVILILRDILPFHQDRLWLEEFGPVLALYHDPLQTKDGFSTSAHVTQYEDGLKIDFSLWPVEKLRSITARPDLPPEFDAGYRVLLDKDGLTEGLKPSTYRAYIPTPPGECKYQETVESFFLNATYVAKFLWRDDLVAAKHLLDYYIKQENLIPMLEWRMEIEYGWSVRPGLYGQRLKKWLRPDLWAEFESTYTGSGLALNWEALYRAIALFRKAALEVGERLGYAYLHEVDLRTVAYLREVQNLAPGELS